MDTEEEEADIELGPLTNPEDEEELEPEGIRVPKPPKYGLSAYIFLNDHLSLFPSRNENIF